MKVLVMILALMLVVVFALAAPADLSGTWKGQTVVDGADVALTLVLEKKGESYTGTVTDSAGFSKESEIRNAEFQDDTFSFVFTIFNGTDYLNVIVSMTVEGNIMRGLWESEDGNSGNAELMKHE